jgi:hypothetical protein
VTLVEMCSHLANRKGGDGNPPPHRWRARALSQLAKGRGEAQGRPSHVAWPNRRFANDSLRSVEGKASTPGILLTLSCGFQRLILCADD